METLGNTGPSGGALRPRVEQLCQQARAREGTVPDCARVVAAVDRIGDRLTAAERDKRWQEVAQLLRDELVPALRG